MLSDNTSSVQQAVIWVNPQSCSTLCEPDWYLWRRSLLLRVEESSLSFQAAGYNSIWGKVTFPLYAVKETFFLLISGHDLQLIACYLCVCSQRMCGNSRRRMLGCCAAQAVSSPQWLSFWRACVCVWVYVPLCFHLIKRLGGGMQTFFLKDIWWKSQHLLSRPKEHRLAAVVIIFQTASHQMV